MVCNVFSSFCSSNRNVARAARKNDPKASIMTTITSVIAFSMAPRIGSSDCRIIGNTTVDRSSTRAGNRHM